MPLFKQFVLWRGGRRLAVGEEDLQTNRIASVFKVSAATRSLCEWLKLTLVTLLTLALLISHSPHTRSPHHSHALQELKDDLLKDLSLIHI